MIIPLDGVVGVSLDNDKWFTATDFQKAVQSAEKAKAEVVILEIKSPGGRVDVEEEIIRTILDSAGRGMHFVAFVKDAGSAAALITLSCKEIFVTPSARVGAAVTIVTGGAGGTSSLKRLMQGDEELAAKFESFHGAIHKAAAESTGRSPAIAAAMRDMSCELWWSKDGGFSNHQRTPSDERIDGAKEVLTLTAGTMERTGLAITVNSINDVVKLLGLRHSARIQRLDSEMQSTSKKLDQYIKQLVDKDNKIENATKGGDLYQVDVLKRASNKILNEAKALIDKP